MGRGRVVAQHHRIAGIEALACSSCFLAYFNFTLLGCMQRNVTAMPQRENDEGYRNLRIALRK